MLKRAIPHLAGSPFACVLVHFVLALPIDESPIQTFQLP